MTLTHHRWCLGDNTSCLVERQLGWALHHLFRPIHAHLHTNTYNTDENEWWAAKRSITSFFRRTRLLIAVSLKKSRLETRRCRKLYYGEWVTSSTRRTWKNRRSWGSDSGYRKVPNSGGWTHSDEALAAVTVTNALLYHHDMYACRSNICWTFAEFSSVLLTPSYPSSSRKP